MKLANIYYNLMETESAKSAKLVQYDVLDSNEHERIYTRIFYDEIQTLATDESFMYNNTNFAIMPTVSKYIKRHLKVIINKIASRGYDENCIIWSRLASDHSWVQNMSSCH